MANKRLSELNELVAANVIGNDLFYVVDVATNVLEGKKIKASSIQSYVLNNGKITGSITYALLANTASYVDPSTIGVVNSASYALSSSRSERSNWALYSDTASYVSSSNIDGPILNSRYSISASYASSSTSASYVIYSYKNGKIEYAQTASYLFYDGVTPNGIAFLSVSASYVRTSSLSKSSSYLIYDGITPNGTASYANYASSSLTSSYTVSSSYSLSSSYSSLSNISLTSRTSSYLIWSGETLPNGTSSYSWNGRFAAQSRTASYIYYDGITPNGTSSYSIYASSSLSSSYALSSSRSEITFMSVSSSYALTASYPGLDTNQYKIYGPFNTTDAVYGTQTSTELSYRNFVINPPPGVNTTTVIIQALYDVKVPITTTDTDNYTVELILEDWTNGSLVGSFTLDTSRPNNYVNLSITGAFTLSGYNRQNSSLMGSNTSIQTVSGSWYTLRVKASNGATFDAKSLLRGAQFFLYARPDTTITRTAYPPFP